MADDDEHHHLPLFTPPQHSTRQSSILFTDRVWHVLSRHHPRTRSPSVFCQWRNANESDSEKEASRGYPKDFAAHLVPIVCHFDTLFPRSWEFVDHPLDSNFNSHLEAYLQVRTLRPCLELWRRSGRHDSTSSSSFVFSSDKHREAPRYSCFFGLS